MTPPSGKGFESLRDYLDLLEADRQLVRIREPVSTSLEMTEIHRRAIAIGGPAILFEQPVLPDGRPSTVPVLTNLFGTIERVARGMGTTAGNLKDIGNWLAFLKQPQPPKGWREALDSLPMVRSLLAMRPETVRNAPVQETVVLGERIDLTSLPVQGCWPGEPAPLVTWPLVVTRPPDSESTADYNVGVYRMQVTGRRTALMRWLAHRGGARHHRQWQQQGRDMPVAVAIGTDPGTMLAAVMPLPDALSELHFAGLLRRKRVALVPARTVPLLVPANAEMVLEGHVSASETAPEGPYGDHTGYYNGVEPFPVFTLSAVTMRRNPIYLSTFTGRAPDEPSVIGEALNEVFLPLLRQQFPEIIDFWLPPEACSYRIGVIKMAKRYPGHARRIMMGVWSSLPQFSYTKLLIVVDEDVDARSWPDIMWAVATRADASRDLLIVDGTPIDYLDFASPVAGLGGKLGIDATNKIGGETAREWGRPLAMDEAVVRKIDSLWARLGIAGGKA